MSASAPNVPLELLLALYKDCVARCSTVDSSKDKRTLKSRLSHEGLSFLTITLPNFGDDFFRAIEEGKVTSDIFIGWRKRRCLPAFLRGFTSLVFDESTGGIKDASESQIEAIRSIRQLSYFFKKVKMPCTDQREHNALADYVQIDYDLAVIPQLIDDETLSVFKKVCRMTMSTVVGEMLNYDELIPHHGPGSTAEAIQGNKKYCPELYQWFSEYEAAFVPAVHECAFRECQVEQSELFESSVRVITVPKTLKKPRVIAMEPVSTMLLQQGLKDYLVPRIERSSFFSGHVCFSDQEVNKKLALDSSRTGSLATLDLSAASDRVHNYFAQCLFAVNPEIDWLIQLCRTPMATLDKKGLEEVRIRLNKFASMGSALCFPIEALFFANVLLVSFVMRRGKSTSFTYKDLCTYIRDIYVYGDDILIPVDEVDFAITTLRKFGNVVGTDKSFWKGRFRESCGMDAYAGVEVTPTYLRYLPDPCEKVKPKDIVSLVATVNLLSKRGFMESANVIKTFVEAKVGVLPHLTREDTGGLGWFDESFASEKRTRFNKRFQRREVQTLVPVTVKQKDRLQGYNALWRCLVDLERRKSNTSDALDTDKLDRSPVRGALTLKRRWVEA